MLNNSFFHILNKETGDNQLQVSIRFDSTHPIFEGHFPGQPVVPGVCMLQMIKELVQDATGEKLFLSQAASCKFLNVIDPLQTPDVTITISYTRTDNSDWNVNATIAKEAITFLKLKAVFGLISLGV